MAKIIIGFADLRVGSKLASELKAAGHQVLRVCTSANEILRAFADCDDGILVCGCRFEDRTVQELADDLGEQALMLLVGKPERLALCELKTAFRLPLPVTRAELVSSVNILVQLHQMRLPKRSADETGLVSDAKIKLMRQRGMSEPQAHRLIQKSSMRLGIRMAECAQMVLDGKL